MSFTPLDEFSFHARLSETAGPALIIFTSAGCSSCRAWKLVLSDYIHLNPLFPVFEVDAGHAQALAREFNVFHLPALFLYSDGHFHCPIECEARMPALTDAIRQALVSPAQEAP